MQRHILQLGFALFFIATASAQITNPDKLVAPLPRNPAVSRPHLAADDQWLWQYAAPSNKPALLADPRFYALLSDNLKAPQAFWGTGISLSDAAQTFLAGPGTVVSNDNRHITITGCVTDIVTDGKYAHCSRQRGVLYADLGERSPLLVFAALRWNEQGRATDEPGAPFTLWVFPSRELDAHQLPQPLKDSFSAFTRGDGCKQNNITNVIIVDPTGVPHILGTLEAGVMPIHCDPRPVRTTPRN